MRGASGKRLLTDIVSLVRFALHQDDELVPLRRPGAGALRRRGWRSRRTAGAPFTDEQRRWLEMMRDHVATSLEIDGRGLRLAPFVGGGRAREGDAGVRGGAARGAAMN